MSMSTHVIGIVAVNAEYQKKYKAYKACEDAEVDIPQELIEFFNGESPDPNGMVIDLRKNPCVKKYSADMIDGFDIDLSKVDKNIKIIRFYNSY